MLSFLPAPLILLLSLPLFTLNLTVWGLIVTCCGVLKLLLPPAEGRVLSTPTREAPAERPALGRMPALACSARARLASYCSRADW